MNSLRKFLNISILSTIIFAGAATAQVSCNGVNNCTGPAGEIIGSLFPSPNGGVLIASDQLVSELPCTGAQGGANVFLPSDHQNYKETYATLLTASVADKNVVLRIDTNEAECTLFFARMFN